MVMAELAITSVTVGRGLCGAMTAYIAVAPSHSRPRRVCPRPANLSASNRAAISGTARRKTDENPNGFFSDELGSPAWVSNAVRAAKNRI